VSPPRTPQAWFMPSAPMARDQATLMRQLGFAQFGPIGHDHGARVAYRLVVDNPGTVTRLAVLDIVPTRHVLGFVVLILEERLRYLHLVEEFSARSDPGRVASLRCPRQAEAHLAAYPRLWREGREHVCDLVDQGPAARPRRSVKSGASRSGASSDSGSLRARGCARGVPAIQTTLFSSDSPRRTCSQVCTRGSWERWG